MCLARVRGVPVLEDCLAYEVSLVQRRHSEIHRVATSTIRSCNGRHARRKGLRAVEPRMCLHVVLRDAVAIGVHDTEVELCRGISLFRRPAIPGSASRQRMPRRPLRCRCTPEDE